MFFYIESPDGSNPDRLYSLYPPMYSPSYYRLGLSPIEAYDEELARKNRMARRIQIQWRECSSNPRYLICRTRLEREFQIDCEPPSRYSGNAYDCYRSQNWPAESVIHILKRNPNEEEYCGPAELLERFELERRERFPDKLKKEEEFESRSRATHGRADIPRDVRQIQDTSTEVPKYWGYQLRPKKNRMRARRVL